MSAFRSQLQKVGTFVFLPKTERWNNMTANEATGGLSWCFEADYCWLNNAISTHKTSLSMDWCRNCVWRVKIVNTSKFKRNFSEDFTAALHSSSEHSAAFTLGVLLFHHLGLNPTRSDDERRGRSIAFKWRGNICRREEASQRRTHHFCRLNWAGHPAYVLAETLFKWCADSAYSVHHRHMPPW